MKVKKVVIENFGSYYGRQEIDLSLGDGSADKNIIVVYGENGAGKTTFLTALVWCLYGRSMDRADKEWGEAWKKVKSDEYLNNEVRERDGKRATQSVEIVFTETELNGVPAGEISVKRSRRFGDGFSDEIAVRVGKEDVVDGNDLEANRMRERIIRENILPIEVAKFFLFDAQKIISFADFGSTEQNRDLKESFSQVLGIAPHEELQSRLVKIAQGYRTLRAKPAQKAEFRELKTKEENLDKTLIPAKDAEIEEKDAELEKISEARDKATNELIKISGGVTPEDEINLKRSIDDAEAELAESGEELKSVYPLMPFAIAGKLCSETREQLELEEISRKRGEQDAEISEKIGNVRRDLDDIAHEKVPHPNQDAYRMKTCLLESLQDVLLRYFGNADHSDEELPQGFRSFLGKDAGFSERFSNLLEQVVAGSAKFDGYRKKFEKTKQLRDERVRTLERLAVKLDDAEAKQIREDIRDLTQKFQKVSEERGKLDQERKKLLDDLTVTRRSLSELDKELRAAQSYDKKSELIDTLVKEIGKFIGALQEKKKDSLKKRILTGTQRLMHKEDLVADVSVEISSENGLRVRFLDKDGNELPSMSEGERQLCASALLQSLSDESGFEFPVFIDSPLQKFDSEHAKNMVEMFYPNVSSQVVFFPLLGKELTREEYEILSPHVAKVWRIENTHNRSGFCRVADISADELFPPQDSGAPEN